MSSVATHAVNQFAAQLWRGRGGIQRGFAAASRAFGDGASDGSGAGAVSVVVFRFARRDQLVLSAQGGA